MEKPVDVWLHSTMWIDKKNIHHMRWLPCMFMYFSQNGCTTLRIVKVHLYKKRQNKPLKFFQTSGFYSWLLNKVWVVYILKKKEQSDINVLGCHKTCSLVIYITCFTEHNININEFVPVPPAASKFSLTSDFNEPFADTTGRLSFVNYRNLIIAIG